MRVVDFFPASHFAILSSSVSLQIKPSYTPETNLDTQIANKSQGVHKHLHLLGGQGKFEGIFNNLENADKLSGLVEDTKDAMMWH